ncbi:MAG: formylmethanofuran dehydrogenase subunit C [Planctomycetia bacterium]|nr:formylmethanofuran dehydrogenase subunit C [Planctomycetia bacterium]
MLRLTYTGNTTIPLEAEWIVPDRLVGRTAREIANLPVQYGNAAVPLGEFFRVEGDAGDHEIVLAGDCSRVKLVGAGMKKGKLTVEGNIGMHVGAEMKGGLIEIRGDAADWAGVEMRGGTLRIRGNAGHLVGGCYRGGRTGMRGGTILVDGNVGNELGHSLRRGFITVGGSLGDFAGVSMIAGTIFAFGEAGLRLGAGMKRGTIAAFGRPPELLSTFRYACRLEPLFLRPYFRWLRTAGFPVAAEHEHGACHRYSGDLVSLGKGEILVFGD